MAIGRTLTRLIAGVAVLLLVPGSLVVQAQPATKVFRIGLLGSVPPSDPGASHLWDGFFGGLRQFGYVERQNIVIEGRYSEGRSERLPTLAAELVRLQILEARAPTEWASALSTATTESADALLVLPDPMVFGERRRLVDLAAKSRLPLVGTASEYAEAGALLTYGIDVRDNYRRAATYVDKILKGTKPADLPVEQPTTFQLVVNLKAAKSLGVSVPPAVVARAHRVIE